jgi:hypothetical protein
MNPGRQLGTGAAPELYLDNRETRAFDEERYNWSFRLKGIVTDLERRKCYFAGREHFVTLEAEGMRFCVIAGRVLAKQKVVEAL